MDLNSRRWGGGLAAVAVLLAAGCDCAAPPLVVVPDGGADLDGGGPSDGGPPASCHPNAAAAPFGQPQRTCAFTVGGGGRQFAYGVAVRGDGHLAVAGAFEEAFDLGDGLLTLPAGGTSAGFVAEFDAQCQLQWSAVFAEVALGVAFDSAGEVWAFGQGGTQAGGAQASLARFDAQGTQRFGATLGSAQAWTGVSGLAVDADDGVVLGGQYTGALTLSGTALPDAGSSTNLFAAKLWPDGGLAWAKGFGGGGTYCQRMVSAVALDCAGGVVLAGLFGGNPDGCSLAVGGPALSAPGYPHSKLFSSVVAALSAADGSPRWSRGWPGSLAQGAAVTAGGTVYVSGWLDEPVDFGSGPIGATDGGRAGYVAALSWNGAPQWGVLLDGRGGASRETVGGPVATGLAWGERALVLGTLIDLPSLLPDGGPVTLPDGGSVIPRIDTFLQVAEADGSLGWTSAAPGAMVQQAAAGPSGELVLVGWVGDAGAQDVWLERRAR